MIYFLKNGVIPFRSWSKSQNTNVLSKKTEHVCVVAAVVMSERADVGAVQNNVGGFYNPVGTFPQFSQRKSYLPQKIDL